MGDLHESIQRVVEQACAANAHAERFPKHWLFHVRWTLNRGSKSVAEKCGAVQHFDKYSQQQSELDIITVGQRTTVYDKLSQKLSVSAWKLVEAKNNKAEAAGNGAGKSAALGKRVNSKAVRNRKMKGVGEKASAAGEKSETNSGACKRAFPRLRLSTPSDVQFGPKVFPRLRLTPRPENLTRKQVFVRLRPSSRPEDQPNSKIFRRLYSHRSAVIEL